LRFSRRFRRLAILAPLLAPQFFRRRLILVLRHQEARALMCRTNPKGLLGGLGAGRKRCRGGNHQRQDAGAYQKAIFH